MTSCPRAYKYGNHMHDVVESARGGPCGYKRRNKGRPTYRCLSFVVGVCQTWGDLLADVFDGGVNALPRTSSLSRRGHEEAGRRYGYTSAPL